MKSEWTYRPLGELVSFASGGTPSKKRDDYWGGTIPWISAKTLKTENIDTSDLFITEEGLKAGSKIAPKGSILLLTRGSGLFNGIPISRVEKDVAFNQDIKCLDSYGEVENEFIFYWLLSQKDYLMAKVGVTGIGAGKFDLDFLQKLMIPIPSERERKSIVGFASSISEKIRCNAKINDNLQQQAFAAFDNLVANAENTDCNVSDYAFLNPKRALAKNQMARSIDMSRLSTSRAFPSGWEMKPFAGGMRFTNGDTLLARITPCLENGKTAFIDFLDDGEVAFGSTEYIVLAPKNDTPPEMLYCLARNPAFIDYAVKNMNGSSGRQRVSAETVGQYRLPLFDKHSLSIFREVVSPMFLKMRYNSLENMRLAELRDELLPKLMSGEIGVSNIRL